MRDNIELFEKEKMGGLCRLTAHLCNGDVITEDEEEIIDKYIYRNAPKRYSEYTGMELEFKWTQYELKPRLKWLNEQIKKL